MCLCVLHDKLLDGSEMSIQAVIVICFQECHQIFITLLLIDANQISIYSLRDCMVNKKKGCEDANFEHYKQSDKREFSADAKIIIALLRKQPQKRLELIKSACINQSSFSKSKRLFINRGILKKGDKGYSLRDYKEVPSLWDSKVEKMKNAGAHLTKIQIERFSLGDQDPITGWPKKIFDEVTSTKGFIVFKGATKLEAVLRLAPHRKYSISLVVPVSTEKGERITCLNKIYNVEDTAPFFDGETLSYTVANVSRLG